MKTHARLLLTVALFTLIADQSSKLLAMGRLTPRLDGLHGLARVTGYLEARAVTPSHDVPVVEGFLTLHYVESSAASWGLWANLPERMRQPFLVFVSLMALGFIGFMLVRIPEAQRRLRIALALVLGGALGNLCDRVLRGAVIDFIDLHWRDRLLTHWPTFNVADLAIGAGMAALLLDALQVRPGVLARSPQRLSGVAPGAPNS